MTSLPAYSMVSRLTIKGNKTQFILFAVKKPGLVKKDAYHNEFIPIDEGAAINCVYFVVGFKEGRFPSYTKVQGD
jgi:hypothetical protein